MEINTKTQDIKEIEENNKNLRSIPDRIRKSSSHSNLTKHYESRLYGFGPSNHNHNNQQSNKLLKKPHSDAFTSFNHFIELREKLKINEDKIINPHVNPDHTAEFFSNTKFSRNSNDNDQDHTKDPESILKNKFEIIDPDIEYYNTEESVEKFWILKITYRFMFQYIKLGFCSISPSKWFPLFGNSSSLIQNLARFFFAVLISIILMANTISLLLNTSNIVYEIITLELLLHLIVFTIASMAWTKNYDQEDLKDFDKIIQRNPLENLKYIVINEIKDDYEEINAIDLAKYVISHDHNHYQSKLKQFDIWIIIFLLTLIKLYLLEYKQSRPYDEIILLILGQFPIPYQANYMIYKLSIIGYYVIPSYLSAVLITSVDMRSKYTQIKALNTLLYPDSYATNKSIRINICCERSLRIWKRLFTLIDKTNSRKAFGARFIFTFYMVYLITFTIIRILLTYSTLKIDTKGALGCYLQYHYKVDILIFTIPLLFRITYGYMLSNSFIILKRVINLIQADVASLLNEDLEVIKLSYEFINYQCYSYLVKCLRGYTTILAINKTDPTLANKDNKYLNIAVEMPMKMEVLITSLKGLIDFIDTKKKGFKFLGVMNITRASFFTFFIVIFGIWISTLFSFFQ